MQLKSEIQWRIVFEGTVTLMIVKKVMLTILFDWACCNYFFSLLIQLNVIFKN